MFFTKKVSLSVLFLTMTVVFVDAAKSTKKLQVMLNPQGPDFTFYLNAGNGIVANPSTNRPAGSYALVSGLLFPGGTMSKNQSSFLVDKNGHLLSAANSLGRWQTFEKTLTDINLNNLPSAGTLIMMSEWGLYFNSECHEKPNNIYLLGSSTMGNLMFNEVFLNWTLGMVGGTGCNAHNNTATAKLYIASDGTSLIKIKFVEDVKYE